MVLPDILSPLVFSIAIDSWMMSKISPRKVKPGKRFVRLILVRFSPSDLPRLWNTLMCLQEIVVPWADHEKTGTCKELNDYAFASHVKCYTGQRPDVCDLPISDWFQIAKVVGIKEMLEPETIKFELEVAAKCLGQWLKFLEALRHEQLSDARSEL